MNLEKIIQCQHDLMSNVDVKSSEVRIVPLLEKLTGNQLEQLQNGSGNPVAEMYQINSSAGLAVNYYKLFEKTHKGVNVEFEWKESIPILRSSAPANLDVRYEYENTIYFVESKFFEPYYMSKQRNSEAYFDTTRYPFVDNRETWKALLENQKNFDHYDFAQMCRHLMAIYRHFLENPEIYKGKKIVLQSVTWKMTDYFLNQYNKSKSKKDDTKGLLEKLSNEKDRALQLFNDHIKKIGWNHCCFEIKHYNDNDMLNAISNSKKFEDFKKQYFL